MARGGKKIVRRREIGARIDDQGSCRRRNEEAVGVVRNREKAYGALLVLEHEV